MEEAEWAWMLGVCVGYEDTGVAAFVAVFHAPGYAQASPQSYPQDSRSG